MSLVPRGRFPKQWPRMHPKAKLWPQFLLLGMLVALPPVFALQPQLDTDELLKPLVDTHSALQGAVDRQGEKPVHDDEASPSGATHMLTGQVKTLQQAIEAERDTVDWYAWYLSARAYLGKTGGLECAMGTPIKFYRNGQIEAMSFDQACRDSVADRNFPLPRKTKLDALILPVRNGSAPPATPQELYSRIKALQFK